MASRDTDVREYESRYNYRDDGQATFSPVAERTRRVPSGKRGEYSPAGK
jgi:hypothetical protein